MVGEKLRETPLIPVRERNAAGRRRHRARAPIRRIRQRRRMERLKTLGGGGQSTPIAQRADGAIEMQVHRGALRQAAGRCASTPRARPFSAAPTTPAWSSRTSRNRATIASWSRFPASTPAKWTTLVETLTQAGVLTFNMVDAQANAADYTIGVPRNNRVALPNDGQGGAPQVIMLDAIITGSDLSGAKQDFDQYSRPQHRLPAARPRRAEVRQGDDAPMSAGRSPSCSTTASSRRRSSSRPDHGRQRPDHRQLHAWKKPSSSPSCCAPARCRPSCRWWNAAWWTPASAPTRSAPA